MSDNPVKKSNSKKGIIIGASTLIIAVVLYFVLAFPWPSENVTGTIGGVEKAKKYQKEQITNQDVAVQAGDIQQLLQNDKIQKMINDPNFRIAADNEAFRTEFNRNQEFRDAILSEAYATAMSNKTFNLNFRNENFRTLLKRGVVLRMVSDNALKEALRNESLRQELAGKSYELIINRNESLRALQQDASLKEAMRNESLRNEITSDAFLKVINDGQLTEALKTEALKTVCANKTFEAALKQESFLKAAESAGFTAVLRSEALKSYWNNDAFRTELFRTEAQRNVEAQKSIEAQRNVEAQKSIEAQRSMQK